MSTAFDPRPAAPFSPAPAAGGAGGAAAPWTGSIVGKRVSNLHLVREKDRRRTRDLGAVALILAPIAIVLLVFAWENVEAIRRGYELRKIGAERDRLLEENRQLRGRLASLASLSEAERRARAEGFVDPVDGQTVHLASGTPAPEPAAAVPAAAASPAPPPVAEAR